MTVVDSQSGNARAFLKRGPQMPGLLVAIEARRKKIPASKEALARAAGIDDKTYRRVVAGSARPATVQKLLAALDRLERAGPAAKPGDDQALAWYNAFLAVTAPLYGYEPDEVRASDPRLGATADGKWRALRHAAQAAMYLAITEKGIAQAALARALGITDAAVSLAIKDVENRRGSPLVDAQIERAGRAVTGRV